MAKKYRRIDDYIQINKEIKSTINPKNVLKMQKYSLFLVDMLIQESYCNMEYVGETIERKCKELLKEFNFSRNINNFCSYLMREIMRNVIEHSEAQVFFLLIYYNDSEFGFKVIDEGIGIKESLSKNPRYNVIDDKSALAFAIRPGITRSYKKDPHRDSEWQNSGFGLYMVSNIVRKLDGRFEIASGNDGIIMKNGFFNHYKNNISGTEVSVIFEIKQQMDTFKLITEIAKQGNQILKNCKNNDFLQCATIKTASKASTLIKK